MFCMRMVRFVLSSTLQTPVRGFRAQSGLPNSRGILLDPLRRRADLAKPSRSVLFLWRVTIGALGCCHCNKGGACTVLLCDTYVSRRDRGYIILCFVIFPSCPSRSTVIPLCTCFALLWHSQVLAVFAAYLICRRRFFDFFSECTLPAGFACTVFHRLRRS